MVITLHLLNPSLLKGVTYARQSGSFLNEIVMSWLFCFSITAVDIFIIISGYFMITNNRRKLGKAINLMFVCSAYSVVKCIVNTLAAGSVLTAKAVAASVFPKSYYVYIYCALYLLSPYINKAVDRLNKRDYKKLLGVMLVLFSVWPTVMDCVQAQFGLKYTDISFISADGNGRGFTFVNFVLLYLIGGYIRKYGSNDGKYKNLFYLLFFASMSVVISLVLPKLWGTNGIIGYESVIVIIQAVSMFEFFSKLNIKYNAVINFFAKASFGVFLAHMAVFKILGKFIDMEARFKAGTLSALICYIILLFTAYFVSAAFDSLARFVMSPISNRWSKTKLFAYDTGFTEDKKGGK